MHTDVIQALTTTFEAHAQQTETGVEYWLARDLQFLLGYSKWDNFLNVVSKAKTACDVSGHPVADHFAGVGKMVERNNDAVRRTLRECGIRPETLPPAEDVKKVERRLASENKKSLGNPGLLET